jgi:DNA-binding SARP family transcriptional activator
MSSRDRHSSRSGSASAAAHLLRRPALEARFSEGLGGRLTLVTADAGFGKSTLLSLPLEGRAIARYTATPGDRHAGSLVAGLVEALGGAGVAVGPLPTSGNFADDQTASHETLASAVSEALGALGRDVVMAIDDVHEIPRDSPGARLVEALVRQAPSTLHVAMGSREPPPFPIQRLRGGGDVIELTAGDLAFDAEEIARFAALSIGPVHPTVVEAIDRSTGGWPAAVRLALEALRPVPVDRRAEFAEQLERSPAPILEYLAEEVLDHQSDEVRELLAVVSLFDRFSAGMLRALGIREPGRIMLELERRGLLVRLGAEHAQLHRLVRAVSRERLVLSPARRRSIQRKAIDWMADSGDSEAALRLAIEVEDPARLEAILVHSGEHLIERGRAELILEAVGHIPSPVGGHVAEVAGQAHAARGEWDAAIASYHASVRPPVGDPEGRRLPARLAWRVGGVEFDRGRFAEAARVLGSPPLDEADPVDAARVLGALAPILWNSGDPGNARSAAIRALERASASGDHRAQAAAHLAMAMTDPEQSLQQRIDHLRAGLGHAEAGGDAAQATRLRVNLATMLGPAEALRTITPAVVQAEALGSAAHLGVVLNNRGEDLLGLGRYEEAAADLRRAAKLLDLVGSPRAAWALMNHGDVARETGDLGLARTLYADALRRAELAGDAQGEIGASAGLARLASFVDPRAARERAWRAVERARPLGLHLGRAMLAAGWVAVLDGRADEAASLAGEAGEAARRQGWPPDAAEALELRAVAGEDSERRGWLEAAAAEWAEIGNQPARLRVELALASLDGDRAAVRSAQRQLRHAGVRDRASGAAGLLATLHPEPDAPVEIRSLGGFELRMEGRTVPSRAWRSRKSRDLLKMLLCRRGRPTVREELAQRLWPDEQAATLGPRLSVTASLLRGVLQAGRPTEAELLGADRGHLWLWIDRLVVDVEEFLAEASRGLLAVEEGTALGHLEVAERLYAGDFLEDEPYADWAVALREEARTTYVSVARRLAEIATGRGDHERAIQYLFRILERDPYDEAAHLSLVTVLEAARRHGEARRAFRAYVRRMEELGIEAAAYPASGG